VRDFQQVQSYNYIFALAQHYTHKHL